jgi:aspartyl/asparaginyl beta-hydroxylase (cupin superfamily)
MFANMHPGTVIPKHFDKITNNSFKKSHRIHVPILTNDEVYFIIGDARCVAEVGKAYEINNRKQHGVENKGDTDRVHLIFDIYIPSEFGTQEERNK